MTISKYAISVWFLLYSLRCGYVACQRLINGIQSYPFIIEMIRLVPVSDQIVMTTGLVIDILHFIPIVLLMVSCFLISQKHRNWRFIMWCGLFGCCHAVMTFLEASLTMIMAQVFFADTVWTLMQMMIIPCGIFIFAAYCKKQEQKGEMAYYPIPLLPAGKITIRYLWKLILSLRRP